MKREYKELLLKDICARVPYKVCVEHTSGFCGTLHDITVYFTYNNDGTIKDYICHTNFFKDESCKIEFFKPYLFPISSITKEIEDEIYQETGLYDIFKNDQIHIEVGGNFEDICKLFEILNKYHIDYRGLISLGLAIDATGKNIY